MAKEATLQVRMDAEVKRAAEELYRSLGTSFAEAVRIFAKRSVDMGAMPFAMKRENTSAFGALHRYANPKLRPMEEGAWEREVVSSYEKQTD